MSKVRLSESEKSAINTQAQIDSTSGNDTQYSGSHLTDAVFSVLDQITDTPSTVERAAAKQDFYDDCRKSLDRSK